MIPRNGKITFLCALSGLVSSVLVATMPNALAEAPNDRHGLGKQAPPPPPPEAPKARTANPSKAQGGQSQTSADAEKYCASIGTNTTQAANLLREQQLRELETQIEQRIKELDAKRAQVQQLIDKSEAIFSKADQSLIDLYSKMKPDAAASQIAKLDDDIAVALLVHVKTKEMSAIMDEMEPERGAVLAKKLSQKIRAQKEGKPN